MNRYAYPALVILCAAATALVMPSAPFDWEPQWYAPSFFFSAMWIFGALWMWDGRW